MKKVLQFLIILFLFFSSFGPTYGQEEPFSPQEIIVKFTPGASLDQINKFNQRFQAQIKEKLAFPRVFSLKVPKGFEEHLARIYNSLPIVEYAEPNFVATAQLVPNDPYFSNQWGLTKIQAPQAWDIAAGSPEIKIAILDTGIDKDHQDLAAKIAARVNFTSAFSDDDLNGHGTHVAGIAAAITNNNLGVAGTGFDTSLVSVKVLNDKGSGYYSWIANGIKWAADNGASVINMSLSGSSSSKTLEEAVNYAWGKNVVLNCAAGNYGSSTPVYPAYYQNCIAVAATDSNDQKASWSNYGSWVEVAAPGLEIFSTLPNHNNRQKNTNYGSLSGTSMATPFVSGLAGLIFSENSSLDNSQVRNLIEEYADKISGTGSYWSKGRINAFMSISSIASSGFPTATPTLEVVPTEIPTPTPTPISVPTSTPTPIPPTPTNTPTLTPTPTPVSGEPTPTPTPWWCRYFPNHPFCQ